MVHWIEIEDDFDLVSLHQLKPEQYPYLLESTSRGHENARFSILMAYPESCETQIEGEPDILNKLGEIPDNKPLAVELPDLPFVGGWFVYLSYEYARYVEPGVGFHTDPSGFPLAIICRISGALITDHHLGKRYIVADQLHPEVIGNVREDIQQLATIEDSDDENDHACRIEEEEPDVYRKNLRQVKQYIHDGDIFQANLSRLWKARFRPPISPTTLYRRLSQSNPAPFASMIRFNQDHYLLSSSPERLVSFENGSCETRPIAGTHPRGQSNEDDEALAQHLLANPKERAEHVMLIDLERNDLGRVCKPGSIKVADHMMLESYRHVHHIVSSVAGELRQGITFKQLIHAVFPGGTITGCPKVRCMEIISELENAPRGPYTGSLGYVSDHGRIDMNILIRSMTLVTGTEHSNVELRAGAGIVNDSVIEKELNETRHKAKGLLNAIQPDN